MIFCLSVGGSAWQLVVVASPLMPNDLPSVQQWERAGRFLKNSKYRVFFNPILLGGGGADLPPPSRICVYVCV